MVLKNVLFMRLALSKSGSGRCERMSSRSSVVSRTVEMAGLGIVISAVWL